MFSKKHPKLEIVIGAGSTVRGEINSPGTIRIDGVVEGTINADCVIIGVGGSVTGDTVSKMFITGGKISGNIIASESVEIQQKGEVYGDIHTQKLSVLEGGVFEGRSIMQKSRELEYRPSALLPDSVESPAIPEIS